MNETPTHPALDEFDAALRQPRQRLAALVAENAELTAEANALRRETTRLTGENEAFRAEVRSLNDARRVLTAELAEARKQPVQVLPVMTEERVEDLMNHSVPVDNEATAQAWNNLFTNWFREAAEARTKPTVDVDALASAIFHKAGGPYVVIRDTLREYLTDAPAPGADAAAQPTTPEAKAAFAARVRRECAENLRADGAKYGDLIPFFWKMTADRMERGE